MIAEREYLHLEEADKIPGLSKFDLIEMFQQDQIKLYCWCNETKLFAEGTFKDNSKPSVLGSFSYQGAVGLPKNNISELLIKQKPTKVKRFLIKQYENISDWTNLAPSQLDYPNQIYLEYKHSTKPKFQFWSFISAVNSSKTESAQSLGRIFNSFMKNNLGYLKDGEQQELDQSTKKLKDYFNDQVSFEQKEFYPADLRFSKKELLILVNSDDLIINAAQEKATHPIDEIIERVLRDLGNVKVNVIWNKLKADSKSPDNKRLYDTENLLDTVENEELSYSLRSGKLSPIRYKTFKKYVTRVRNKLKEEGLISK